MRKCCLTLLLLTVSSLCFAADWPTFGWNPLRSSAPTDHMGVNASNIGTLTRQQIKVDGTVDSSAIYLANVEIGGTAHNAFFVTTTYGKTLSIDADSGTVLWEYTPPSYSRLAGTYRITTSTPVADPDRQFIYAAAPDGTVRKLAVSDGKVVWTTSITRLPSREKIASPLGFFDGRVIAATDGYIGDDPPYQGHVALIDARTGRLVSVWNSLCSDRHALIAPSSCNASDSGIWGRAGVVVDEHTGTLYLATGNGPWNGRTNWGDSVIELNRDATKILGNFTPTNTEQLDAADADLGSTSPVLLGGGLVAQGGKDRKIRLLDWSKFAGSAAHRGGVLASVPTPSGARLFSAPATWRSGGETWLLAADNGGTAAWTVTAHGFQLRWRTNLAGTSPVVADGLAFVYDPNGGLRVYQATTGKLVRILQCGGGHWNSPIIVDGYIILPEGDANRHRTTGVIDIWRLR